MDERRFYPMTTKVFTASDLKYKEVLTIAGIQMAFERFNDNGNPVWSHTSQGHYIEFINKKYTRETPLNQLK